jgi:general secretion pathway protein H
MSATGNRRLDSSAGVTLVETMVALFIVGLVAGAALILMPGPDRTQHEAARRLAARLAQASDASVMLNRRIALVATHEGYGFERLEENGWVRIGDRDALAFSAWPRGVALRPREGELPAGDRLAVFDPVGGASPARIALGDENGDGEWMVEIDSAGAIHVDRAR